MKYFLFFQGTKEIVWILTLKMNTKKEHIVFPENIQESSRRLNNEKDFENVIIGKD